MTVRELDKMLGKQIDFISVGFIMQYVLKMDRNQIIVNANKEVSCYKIRKAQRIAKKVKKGYPIQYAVKKAYFMYDYFYVNKNVLIPRQDTERVVEQVIDIIEEYQKQDPNKRIRILELCTGSGCISVSIAKKVKNVDIVATDISYKALRVAKKNYKKIIDGNNTNTIYFFKSDMFENIKEEEYDIIVSNPPYIETDTIKTLDKEVQKEPHIALDGGEDGLKFYKVIKENVNTYLKKDGSLVLEIGYNQKENLKKFFEGAKCIKDYSDNDRVIIWRRK